MRTAQTFRDSMNLFQIGGFVALAALAALGFTGNLVRNSKEIDATRRQVSDGKDRQDEKVASELQYHSLNAGIYKYGWYTVTIGLAIAIIGLFIN